MTSEPLTEAKKASHREWLWLFAAFTFFLGAILWEGYDRVMLDRRPPIDGDVVLVPIPDVITAGKPLLVRAIRTKVRADCSPLFSERWAVNVLTGETIPLQARVWEGGLVSEETVDLLFETGKLPPGNYRGYARATYPCPDLPPFVYESNFSFSVIGG